MSNLESNEKYSEGYFGESFKRVFKSLGFWVFLVSILLSIYAGKNVDPTWSVEKIALDAKYNQEGQLFYLFKGKPTIIDQTKLVSFSNAQLNPKNIERLNKAKLSPEVSEEYVFEKINKDGKIADSYFQLKSKKHFRFWSLLPAIVAILLCWIIKEPITALLGGIVSGSFLLGFYDITDAVIIPKLMTQGAASIVVLYLLLLGSLLGIWSKTGAAKAFAELMAKHFVRGPKSAKLVAWILGVIFHQGGTMSTVLVGTTVKPLSDEENVSHEELSYIVDSTASPIAALLPFNAWPGYVQAFIYVSGVSYLATEKDRVAFFMKSIPFSFYSILAVLFTLLLCFDKLPFMGKQMKAAIKRSRETGELDGPDAEPLSSKELKVLHIPDGYSPHVIEFFIPILLIIGISMYTFFTSGSPQVRWGFGIAVVVAWAMALMRGMKLKDLMAGLEDGLKGVVVGTVILILAITIGSLSKETGGGLFLVELLGNQLPYWILPVVLQALTMVIAFSTGTSWGTYAVCFPLAMPLALAVAQSHGLAHPEFFLLICFTTVLNGSVFGDQCSPISDTTVLSAMVTGSDLMDHVKTQIIPASVAAGIAAIMWTVSVLLFA